MNVVNEHVFIQFSIVPGVFGRVFSYSRSSKWTCIYPVSIVPGVFGRVFSYSRKPNYCMMIQTRCFLLDYFPNTSLIKPEDSFNPLFKAMFYSVSWVRKLVNCAPVILWFLKEKLFTDDNSVMRVWFWRRNSSSWLSSFLWKESFSWISNSVSCRQRR